MRKKLFSLFALLLMAVTGAWADEDMKTVPLTLEAKTAGTIKVNYPQSGMKYSKNNGAKTAVTTAAINVAEGNKVQFFGSGISITSYYGTTAATRTQITGGTAECYVYGNIMSLVNEEGYATATELTGASAFQALFVSNKKIFNHDSKKLVLPATTLAEGCYYYMFRGCTGLTTAPALPATTLASYCYQSMFYGCTSLTTAPELTATTLAQNCYSNMFDGCTDLTTAPALPATTLASGCYKNMFSGCSKLTTAPALPATTLASYCYQSMFYGCTGLTTVPENLLPATTLAMYCYQSMFRGCTGLTTAPELPATTLAMYCYYEMFRDCSNLNSVTCLATDISASNSTTNWLKGVSSTGTFTKAASMTSWTTGNSGIRSGWTIQETLNEAEDNSSWITTNNGNTFDVKLTRTLQTGGYNTFAVPFNMTIPDGWTVKELNSSSFAGGVLTLNFINAVSIVAGKPYLVKVSTATDLSATTYTDVTISSTTPTSTKVVNFVPTLGKTLVTGYGTDAGNAKTVLFLGAGNKLYNPTVVNAPEQEANYMKGFRAYFQLKGEAAQAPVQSLVMNFNEGATGIISATLNDGAEGTNGEYYDLQGRRIEGQPTQKGVYIVNGKKVIK